MVTFTENNEFSSVLYKKKGLFKKFEIVDLNFEKELFPKLVFTIHSHAYGFSEKKYFGKKLDYSTEQDVLIEACDYLVRLNRILNPNL